MAAPDRPRLRVGVVGAGRVGAVLGAALARAGHRVTAAYAVSAASRRRAAMLLPGVPVASDAADAVRGTDLALLAVPDDALPGVARGLAALGAVGPGGFVAHTSGAHGVGVLDPLVAAGALPLALHPAMTFTGTDVDLARLAGCSFGVTAPDPLVPAGVTLVVEMGAEPVVIAEAARGLYHAALATGANHLVTLVATAMDLLRRAGVDHPDRVLAPLLSAALDNALRAGDAALTGPVARGDAGTVARHVAVLSDAAPEALPAYVALSRLTADRALAAGRLGPDAVAALLGALAGQAPA